MLRYEEKRNIFFAAEAKLLQEAIFMPEENVKDGTKEMLEKIDAQLVKQKEVLAKAENNLASTREKIRTCKKMISDIERMQADPNFSLDSSDGVYIVFLCIGIIGYFTIPTVAGWIIQAGGMGGYGRNVNQMAGRAGGMAGSVAGAATGNMMGRAGKLLK